jgi:hypothetical protein
MRHSGALNEQVQTALNSRVVLEQAEGKLGERLGADMDHAFSLQRNFARARNFRLSELARSFVDGAEALPDLAASTLPQPRPGSRQVRRWPGDRG